MINESSLLQTYLKHLWSHEKQAILLNLMGQMD